MKLAEVKPLIDKLVEEVAYVSGPLRSVDADASTRIALETAFVAGVRSGLKFTSNAKFAEIFGGGKAGK